MWDLGFRVYVWCRVEGLGFVSKWLTPDSSASRADVGSLSLKETAGGEFRVYRASIRLL